MESNFYIASRLAKVRLSEEEKARIGAHFITLEKSPEKQEDFFNYCKVWKLAPWINIQLERNGLTGYLIKNVRNNFIEFYEKVKAENENRNTEALNFLQEFKKEKIEVALLKGNMLLHNVYKDIGYKKMNDFDMLIHPDDWLKVQEIYFHLGYIPLGFGWGGEKGKAPKFSHAGLSFISPNFKCITGTQWGLKSPTSSYKIDTGDLWKSAFDFNFNGLTIKQLTPEYNLLHLVLHMGIYKCGIRDCMDLYNLLLAEPNFSEDRFVKICRDSNALDKAWFTLQLTNQCSDAVSRSLLEKLRPVKNTFLVRRLKARLKMATKTGDMQHSYNDYFHDVEMTVFYFSLLSLFHKKVVLYLQLINQLLWPEKEISRKLSDLGNNTTPWQRFKARLKAPYLTLRLIGEEIGLLITLLLVVKMFFDTLFSVKNYLFRKESYFEYLRKRGINPSDIQSVVKSIQ